MTMIIGLSVVALTTITGGILSNADELRSINFNDFHSKLMGYQY